VSLTIRWRLTLWYVATLCLILICFCAIIFGMFRAHVLSRLDEELMEESRELTREIEFTADEPQLVERLAKVYEDHNYSFQVDREDRSVLYGSPWLRAYKLPAAHSASVRRFGDLSDVQLGTSGWHRMFTKKIRGPSGPLTVYTITSMARTNRELTSFRNMLLGGGAVSLLIALSAGFLIAQRAMQPINRMTATAERISSENLSERVPVSNEQDELGRLAITLNETFSRLQSAIDEMRRFTADAAHELRTPLAVIRTEAEVSLRGHATTDELRRVAEVAVDQTTRLSMLVDQLLTLSRQDAGLQQGGFEDVVLKAVVLDAVESLRKTADQKGVSISVGSLPGASVLGNDVALSQLFLNLLDNAVKFTAAGGTVNVSGTVDDGVVKIWIDDTGIGIDSKDLPHIFERFFRIDRARTAGGTGLGLAICKSIVENHHGSISVESQPGEGSRFMVMLPMREASSGEIASTPTGGDVFQTAS
jgi:heavy metal sensor kinase